MPGSRGLAYAALEFDGEEIPGFDGKLHG